MNQSEYRMGFLPAALCETEPQDVRFAKRVHFDLNGDPWGAWIGRAKSRRECCGSKGPAKTVSCASPAEVSAFNGSCDPHITEVDCRQLVAAEWPRDAIVLRDVSTVFVSWPGQDEALSDAPAN